MKSEMIRKILHMICIIGLYLLVSLFRAWWPAVIVTGVFALLLYPVLTLAERHPAYTGFFSERRRGEVKRSMLLVCGMIIVLMTVYWGGLGESGKKIVLVAVLAWGCGDAAAALVGKAFGKNPIPHPFINGRKTYEGTLAMFLVSFIAIVATMQLQHADWLPSLLVAVPVGLVCATVELFSPHGLDTLTVPFAASFAMFVTLRLLAQLGVA